MNPSLQYLLAAVAYLFVGFMTTLFTDKAPDVLIWPFIWAVHCLRRAINLWTGEDEQ